VGDPLRPGSSRAVQRLSTKHAAIRCADPCQRAVSPRKRDHLGGAALQAGKVDEATVEGADVDRVGFRSRRIPAFRELASLMPHARQQNCGRFATLTRRRRPPARRVIARRSPGSDAHLSGIPTPPHGCARRMRTATIGEPSASRRSLFFFLFFFFFAHAWNP